MMNKRMQNHLKKAGFGLVLGLATLVIDGGQMGPAEAGVRVRARVQTPHVSVHFQNGPGYDRVHRKRVTRMPLYRVTKRDHVIAHRIALATGRDKGNLLVLRGRGLTWFQVGNRLQIPRRVVKNAVIGKTQARSHLSVCSERWRR